MSLVRLAPEAVTELEEAARWYESRRPGLGAEFLDEVEGLLPFIGRRPVSFPRLVDVPPAVEIRRALLSRFPYALVFVVLEREVQILAAAHAKRRPGYWIHRVAR